MVKQKPNVHAVDAELYFLPADLRLPLKFGYDFQEEVLPGLLQKFNSCHEGREVPYLAALVCCSAFDAALHDAYANAIGKDIYETCNGDFMSRDLSALLSTADGSSSRFAGLYPQDFLAAEPRRRLKAWHLVGGLDPLSREDLTGSDPDDGHPVLLTDWIQQDGLDCLKIKLRGTDAERDYDWLLRVGKIAIEQDGAWLSADFNCTVTESAYVNDILDRLYNEERQIWEMLLYVEQPFPYDLEEHRIDVRSVATRKSLFLDESAHDWKFVALGHELGWSGVVLKTCKTQTGALLRAYPRTALEVSSGQRISNYQTVLGRAVSLCWAKAHGMPLMVQDLTNPRLAQIPHVRLAAHADTIMGVETNSPQFYPDASDAEAVIHPGLYKRRYDEVDISALSGSGFVTE